MILSDSTIRDYVETGIIEVDPSPREEQFQPASLDVRIGPEIYDMEYERMQDEIILHPNTPYLGHTIGEISLPNDIAAQLSGRSSVGRRGVVVHQTAGWIDPGFSGEITMELMNYSDRPISFEPGERVGQLVFFQLDKVSSGYDGQYQGQEGPTK